jgi:hypothetical protein
MLTAEIQANADYKNKTPNGTQQSQHTISPAASRSALVKNSLPHLIQASISVTGKIILSRGSKYVTLRSSGGE